MMASSWVLSGHCPAHGLNCRHGSSWDNPTWRMAVSGIFSSCHKKRLDDVVRCIPDWILDVSTGLGVFVAPESEVVKAGTTLTSYGTKTVKAQDVYGN